MTAYRFRLRPLSTWATPWRAASLFGALCWKYRLLSGETALLNWIDAFKDGAPPFVLSDPFPGDLLPLPIGVVPKTTTPKKLRPPLLVREIAFRNLVRALQSEETGVMQASDLVHSTDRLQASIGRNSGTANGESGGALFEVAQESFCEGGPSYFYLYVRADESLAAVRECLAMLSCDGYGKKCSTGLGGFCLEGEPEPCLWLDSLPGANGFVSLSHFVPSERDPRDGYWRLHVTYPKFQGNVVAQPFKGSLLMLTPGSMFRTDGPPKPWYGRMIRIPRPGLERALHYGLCFAAPVVMPNGQ
jgi:CRISPR-associated protein Csm4